ncbi:MAG: methylenetetrahydrofolate reductase [Acidimicrobiales bacterium]
MTDVSFEFFPPKTDQGMVTLRRTADELAAYGPRFMSVTYGAGGSDRDRTINTVTDLNTRVPVAVACHLTPVGSTTDDLDVTIDEVVAAGIDHLVVLRGDPPAEAETAPMAVPTAADLVSHIRSRADGDRFEISVAAYPETHPRAASPQADLDSLKDKLDRGATRAITQFFFDPDVYLRFLDRARTAGITQPIIPGIMPVISYAGITRFAERCAATIPDWLTHRLADLDDDPELRTPVAATIVTEQVRRLVAAGVDEIHIYTLNQRTLPAAVCRNLGLGRAPVPAGPSTAPGENGAP